ADLKAEGRATRIEDALAEAYSELRHLPLAGMVLVSDGAQNGSEAQREAFEELKARRIPIYTLGVGQEEFRRDLQLDDVAMPQAALPGSLVSATVTVRQRGYIGQTARLEVREGTSLLKTRDIRFGPAPVETVAVNFTPRTKGFREFTVRLVPLEGEAIRENNTQSRLVEVQDRTARILYIEGEPRWEFKFVRRALEEDRNLRLVSLLRTSDNKFYRQGVDTPQELADGIPNTKELFKYEGLILGSMQAAFFSPAQQEALYAFVSRRGGGMLFLGGRFALGEGGYQTTSLADLIPVHLRGSAGGSTLQRKPAKFQLTPRGSDRLQLSEDEAANRKNWESLPPLGNYQMTGEPKSGAVILAEAIPDDGRRQPVLVWQRFGRGRTYLFATDASWRWRMEADHKNQSHEIFWRQILHSLLQETPARVSVSAEKSLYVDEQ
ncbi:MAG: glutamine amidotransferase, partial [Terriglobia bacterium]